MLEKFILKKQKNTKENTKIKKEKKKSFKIKWVFMSNKNLIHKIRKKNRLKNVNIALDNISKYVDIEKYKYNFNKESMEEKYSITEFILKIVDLILPRYFFNYLFVKKNKKLSINKKFLFFCVGLSSIFFSKNKKLLKKNFLKLYLKNYNQLSEYLRNYIFYKKKIKKILNPYKLINIIKKIKKSFNILIFFFYKLFFMWIKRRIIIKYIKKYYKKAIANFKKFLVNKLQLLLKKKIRLNIYPLHYYTFRTEIFFIYLKWKLNKRFTFRGLIKPFLYKYIKNPYLLGFYSKGQGRFTRTQRASVIKKRRGKLGISNINAFVFYNFGTIITRYGMCGIRIWINYNKKILSYKNKKKIKLC